ncbi:hypothetical protein D3C86_1094780 [compost metagenome]
MLKVFLYGSILYCSMVQSSNAKTYSPEDATKFGAILRSGFFCFSREQVRDSFPNNTYFIVILFVFETDFIRFYPNEVRVKVL